MTTQDEVRQRAREIWEQEGRPEGREMAHWLQAEMELRKKSGNGQAAVKLTAAVENEMLKVPPTLDKQQENRKRSPRRKPAVVSASA